jgi:hypothetical protein
MAAAAPRARLTFLPAIEAQPIVTEGWALPNSIQHLTVELPVGRTEGVIDVVGESSGQAVGFGLASSTGSGLVNSQSEGSFTAATTGVFTASGTTIVYSKVGKRVTLTYSGAVQAGDTTGPASILISLTNLPSGMRPAQDIWFPVMVSNSAATAIGLLKVPTSGSIEVYRNASLNNFDSQVTTCGVYSFSVSYNVAT